MHMVWGIALLIEPSIIQLVVLVGLHWIVQIGVSAQIVGAMLVTAAILALFSLWADRALPKDLSLALLMPQYALLIAAFISDTQSIITGTVGTQDVDRLTLFTVLWPVMIACVFHSMAIIERHLSWKS
jgi:hypothetical protein